MMRRSLAWLCSIALAAVFAAACVPKIMAPHDFALMVFRYQLLPFALINIVAIYLPWLELASAVGLLFPASRRGAALVILAMLAVFTAALIFNIARGINIACGCFSVDESASVSGWWNVARNALLIALALVALRVRPAREPRP